MCYHNKWGGLVVKELIYILGDRGSILTNDIGCGEHWDVDQIIPTYVTNLKLGLSELR